MLTKAFGVVFILYSLLFLTFTYFVYLNSSAHLDYNSDKGLESIGQVHVFYPAFVALILLIFGVILWKDHVIGEKK